VLVDDTFFDLPDVADLTHSIISYIHVLELEKNHLAIERREEKKFQVCVCAQNSTFVYVCVFLHSLTRRYTSMAAKGKKELNQQKLLRTSIVFFFLFPFSSFLHAILIM
jgi:hypothetical protein